MRTLAEQPGQKAVPSIIRKSGHMRAADWGVLAVIGFEVPSLLLSQYRANSIRTSGAIAVAALVYFLVRLIIRTPLRAAWLAGLLGLGGACLSFLGVRQFFLGMQRLQEAGFTDMVAFRSRLVHPIPGWLPGECFTVFLLALPFACGAAAYIWRNRATGSSALAAFAILPALLIVGALFLSLSRAVFWSTVIFTFGACALMIGYRVISLRIGSLLLGASVGGLMLVLISTSVLYPGIFKAYAGSHTSQVRSTHGRFDIWSRSLKLVRLHPLFGVGSSNAALYLLSTADQDDTTGFASRPFSLPIQVLVEKGVIGFTLYATFLCLVAYEFHAAMRSRPHDVATRVTDPRRLKNTRRAREQLELERGAADKAMKCCFAAGLIAVLFRELTYSSLLEHTLTVALAFTLAALVCGREGLTA